MTISTTISRIEYAGDGSTTAFATNPGPGNGFYFNDDTDLAVYIRNDSDGTSVLQTLTTHYSATGEGVQDGGTLNMVTAPASGETLVLIHIPAFKQEVDLITAGKFPAESVETAIDRTVHQIQRLSDLTDRSLVLGDGDSATGGAYDVNSNRLSNVTDPTGAQDGATKKYVDDISVATTAAAATSASNAAISETNAATSASNAATSETNAANSAVSSAGSASWNTQTEAQTATTLAINTSYLLTHTSNVTFSLPASPAHGDRIRVAFLNPEVPTTIDVNNSDHMIITDPQSLRVSNNCDVTQNGIMQDTGRTNGSPLRPRYIENALITDFKIRNRTTGVVGDITGNVDDTVTCPTVNWTTGDPYLVGRSALDLGGATSGTSQVAVPTAATFVYNDDDEVWAASFEGDLLSLPFNLDRYQYPYPDTFLGTKRLEDADGFHEAFWYFVNELFRLTNKYPDSVTIFINGDVSYPSGNDTNLDLFLHFDPSSDRTITLNSAALTTETYVINGHDADSNIDIILTAGTASTITLISNGEVISSGNDVIIPAGCSARFRARSASEYIVYDAEGCYKDTTDRAQYTISSGAITLTGRRNFVSIDTESDASSDILDTINGSRGVGERLVICAQSSARSILVTNSSNLQLAGGADFTMDHSDDMMELIWEGSNWCELSRSNNS